MLLKIQLFKTKPVSNPLKFNTRQILAHLQFKIESSIICYVLQTLRPQTLGKIFIMT